MKLKLNTVGIAIAGIALIGIIGGETYYIINSKKDIKGLTAETQELKGSLTSTNASIKEKEEQLDAIQEILNGKKAENTTKEVTNNTSEKEASKQASTNNKKMEDVVGEYENNIKFSKESVDSTLYNKLQLSSDGTYSYRQSIYVEEGEYGNWYIDENGDIILNKLFAHSSDAMLRMSAKGETKKLTINEDGSLTDSNKKFKGGELDDLSKIKLNKKSSKTAFKLFDTIDGYRDISHQQGYDYLVVGGD